MYAKRTLILAAAFGLMGGCAGPGPRMLPVAPAESSLRPDGSGDRAYDTNHDGKPDYVERQSDDGRVTLLRFDSDGDGRYELEVERSKPQEGDRHLIIVLDSVPYGLMQELWDQGRFRLFYPPSRTLSPFPVMTDLSLSEFFGVSPCHGCESEFFDGTKLEGGYGNYAHEVNAPWLARTDYHMINFAHAAAYLRPHAWFDHELHYVQKYFARPKDGPFVGYCVGTSALGANQGRNGHIAGLIRVDRMCQQIVHDAKGRVQITLLSDHGHALVSSRRVPTADFLSRCGYRVHDRLERPGDVVVPEFGVVTCAAVYTRDAQRVAQDLTMLDGVDQTMYAEGDDVIVLDRAGRARISSHERRLRYAADTGDPLHMKRVWDELSRAGKADSGGFVDARVLLDATTEHEFPDAVYRIWRAFHGLMQHTPDVMVTVHDGWHCGSKLMSALVDIQAAHGNLGQAGSSGFVMSTMGEVPGVRRMEELREALCRIGVPLNQTSAP